MGALVGLSTRGLDARDALPDQYKRFFAGRLVAQARNAEGLRGLLEHFFRIPVRVLEFVASWMRLPHEALRQGSQDEVMTVKNGVLTARRVTFVVAPDGSLLVRAGLRADEDVVLGPSPEAKDGDKVQVL